MIRASRASRSGGARLPALTLATAALLGASGILASAARAAEPTTAAPPTTTAQQTTTPAAGAGYRTVALALPATAIGAVPHRINNNGMVVGDANVSGHLLGGYIWNRGVATLVPDAVLTGLNDRNQVIGYTFSPTFKAQGFEWRDGVATGLPALSGAAPDSLSFPANLNASGVIVGTSTAVVNGTLENHATIWVNGRPAEVPGLHGPSFGTAINDRGQILGYTVNGNDVHAFVARSGQITDLGSLGGANTYPGDINNRGQVSGVSTTSTGERRPFRWDQGRMTDLGSLGTRTASDTIGLNDRGQVLVQPQSTGPSSILDAFVWTAGRRELVTGPGNPGFEGTAINARGEVAGTIYPALDPTRAYAWSPARFVELPALAADDNARATAINDLGVVAGASLPATNGLEAKPVLWIPAR